MCNNFRRFILFVSSFLTFCSISYSMSEKSNKIVSFQGEEKYIMRLLIDGSRSPNHPFSVTPVARKVGDSFEYITEDDVFNLTENDFKEIHRGNYVYFDQFACKRTRLSGGEKVKVGTLFIGIHDEAHCRSLKKSDFINK